MAIRRWFGAIALIWTMSYIIVARDCAMQFHMVSVMVIIGRTMEGAMIVVIIVPHVNVTMIAMIT